MSSQNAHNTPNARIQTEKSTSAYQLMSFLGIRNAPNAKDPNENSHLCIN
jgi:hypothetical protein